MNSTDAESYLEHHSYDSNVKWHMTYAIKDVLTTCQRLRHKISVLSRRLQRVRTENKRLKQRNKELEDLLLTYAVHQIPQ